MVTQKKLQEWYDEFNDKYFAPIGKELPKIEIELSNRLKSSFGNAAFSCVIGPDGKLKVSKLSIKIMKNDDISENETRDTLLHEMIHVEDYVYHLDHYFYLNNGKITSTRGYDPHGYWFQTEASRINQDGWHISAFVEDSEFLASKKSLMEEGYFMVVGKTNTKNTRGLFKIEQNYFCVKTNQKNLKRVKNLFQKEKRFIKYSVFECHDKAFVSTRNVCTQLAGWALTEDKLAEWKKKYGFKLIETINKTEEK